jgi:superfamily II DNA or RNA helicase
MDKTNEIVRPLHPAVNLIDNSLFFKGLKNFRELETRINQLDSEGKGRVFEIFAEAYLKIIRHHDFINVWPDRTAPSKALNALSIKREHARTGIDGIAESAFSQGNNTYTVYQVKYHSDRKPVVFKKDNLDTFIAVSDSPNVEQKILITNSDTISSKIESRQNIICIRGSDFDRLQPKDFDNIFEFIQAKPVITERQPKRKHQEEGVQAICNELRHKSRALAVMACGTGKTRTCLWVTEKINPSLTLVLLPSLALIKQTIQEWREQTIVPSLATICVCSDSTVKDLDAIIFRPGDLDFPVTTDKLKVKLFLEKPFDGIKVVFSTYQSVQIIAASMTNNTSFDLAIFDEAHKTAGSHERTFSFALNDDNIKIKKRLFVTATPRRYKPSKTNGGDLLSVLSMDNESIYGRRAYTLSFAEAVKRGIICDYHVIVSVITSADINNYKLKHGFVNIGNSDLSAKYVATQLALSDAAERFNVSKIFTFHPKVSSASEFISPGPMGIHTFMPRFETMHVSGKMPSSTRSAILSDFAKAEKALISNARCLTEGVDVPSVDMVAFMSPKESKVDIIQAIGRAMRKSSGTSKNRGYVMLPVFIEDNNAESMDSAASRSGFETVWEVLNALRDHDYELEDTMREISREEGLTGRYSMNRLGEKVTWIGSCLEVESVKNAIVSRSIKFTKPSWDVFYGKLRRYKDEYGHCNVPSDFIKDSSLGNWVEFQRQEYRRGKLQQSRIDSLLELGFDFKPHSTSWRRRYEEYLSHVTAGTTDKISKDLNSWLVKQRSDRKTNDILAERIKLLDEIKFPWNPDEDNFISNFELYKKFRLENPNRKNPPRYGPYKKLGTWSVNLRNRRRVGASRPTPDQINMLDAYSFDWGKQTAKERKSFDQYLSEYIKQKTTGSFTKEIQDWATNMRMRNKRGKVPLEQIEKANTAGFVWNPSDEKWMEKFKQLSMIVRKTGSFNINPREPNMRDLYSWMSDQRRNKVTMSQKRLERVKLLDGIGFPW